MFRLKALKLIGVLVANAAFLGPVNAQSESPATSSVLLQSLMHESIDKIVAEAIAGGNAARGAYVFFQPALACASCHAMGDSASMAQAGVGPNLASPNPSLTDAVIVDSILHPSKSIAKGFETTQVLTTDGQVFTGLVIEKFDDGVRLRDPSTRRVVEIAGDEIETVQQSTLSIMPEGVAGQLTSRQQFLDLVRYLIEIRDGGVARAKELQPLIMPSQIPLPEYESHVDHAGIIGDFDEVAFERGKEIYGRSCVNCHGTIDSPGSLPTSLRFAEGKFKNGFDPHAMYQTITNGFGMMTPQRQWVPQQKYDVIHYIRETFLKPHNASQYARIDASYLASLPKGDTRGPEATLIQPWQQMDYGPNLMATFEIGDDGSNFAYKGHAIRLDQGPGGVAQGELRIVYEHDTMRVAAAWVGQDFIDWNGINFNGAHQRHPRIVGDLMFANQSGAGWANPADDSFEEVRQPGRDGRFYGPLPKDWIDYQGTYVNGQETILSYRVGQTDMLEMPSAERIGNDVVFKRHLTLGTTNEKLTMRVADRFDCSLEEVIEVPNGSFVLSRSAGDAVSVAFGVTGDVRGMRWQFVDDEIRLQMVPDRSPRSFTVYAFRANGVDEAKDVVKSLNLNSVTVDLKQRLQGGAKRWPEILESTIATVDDGGPFAVDTIETVVSNPWFCRMRLTGVDFFGDGESAAVCDWDGNVWKVTGLHESKVTWQRIASGLFQPLGIKIRSGEIFVTCRDQICRLHDFNGDGETDFYESFNHDHLVTEHFHEFAMGLQCDEEGNFYYAKSARHALPALVPHHGTLLKVSADGLSTQILATGFRAANGVCLNDDGTFFVTDQEGHWNPKNRINWVREGRFYGNMMGYHDVTDASDDAMQPPMCWITNAFDRSPAELLWVTSDKWGPLDGSLLNMSYGYGKLYVVPHETKADQMQGGMCELPLPQFPTGIMRGRFHPIDGELYLVGMFAWAGNQEDDGGFYRVRYTGKPMYVPISLDCQGTTIRIGMSDDVDPASVTTENFAISRWNIRRTQNYGSEHFDTQTIEVKTVTWNANRRELILVLPDLKPTWCMEIKFDLQSSAGDPIHRVIHNTIYDLN